MKTFFVQAQIGDTIAMYRYRMTAVHRHTGERLSLVVQHPSWKLVTTVTPALEAVFGAGSYRVESVTGPLTGSDGAAS